jgi:hypothetical protein
MRGVRPGTHESPGRGSIPGFEENDADRRQAIGWGGKA